GFAIDVLNREWGAIAGTAAGDCSEALQDNSRLLAVDSVEGTMVGEMSGLGAGPAAEHGIDRDQPRNVRELLRVAGGNGRIARAIEVFRRNFLALWGVQVAQIFFGNLAGTMAIYVLVHPGHRRFGDD